MIKKLFLLDALALIYRSYYALIKSPRVTTGGKNTNAQFGFTNTLVDLLNKEKPTHIAVCFDTHAPTERHIDFTAYKANRQAAPEDLLNALPDIKKIITGFNIPIVEAPGYEADDIIGTLAWQAAAQNFDVYMVTPDKDYGQLLTRSNIFIYKPPYMGKPFEILDATKICERWNISSVEQVVDILGLMGDTSDNIPGIMGVGEKTAAKLLQEYGNLENILSDATNIKGSLGEKIRAGLADAVMSKKLATIITNVPVQFNDATYLYQPYNETLLLDIFNELEFKTLIKRVLGIETNIAIANKHTQPDSTPNLFNNDTIIAADNSVATNPAIPHNASNTPHEYIVIDTIEKLKKLVATLLQQTEICFDTETTNIDAMQAALVGLSFAYQKSNAYYVPCPADKNLVLQLLEQLTPLFNNERITWVGQNLKYDWLILKNYGIEPKGKNWDTMLAHYLIEPDGKHSMDTMSAQYLHYEPIHIDTLIGKKGKNQTSMSDVAIEKIKEYAAEDADITLQLKQVLAPMVQEKNLENIFFTIENPLVNVLRDMEFEGIAIDTNFLNAYGKELDIETKKIEATIYKEAGGHFNIASPKQLGDILFNKLKISLGSQKTKTGQFATGEDVLQKLASKHTIVENILTFRELTKLNNTYVEALPKMLHPNTNRVHTSYAQAVAVTGRLSSNNPNLQNIPIRTERGKKIRRAFIARDNNYQIVSADYSQIELRIVAAVSGDENMCAAFAQKKDIHTATAAKIFGIAESDVSKEQRYKAKSVNFGILYGQGAWGLSENLKISRAEAKEIIDNYKKEFFGIAKYMEDTIALAQQRGYVETLCGRKRWLRDINSSNFTVRSFAERNAINSPIQGTAADMIKLAMIDIHRLLREKKLQSKMILQVHDELVFDALTTELDILQPLILDAMKNALPLPNNVPLEATLGIGNNWLAAH